MSLVSVSFMKSSSSKQEFSEIVTEPMLMLTLHTAEVAMATTNILKSYSEVAMETTGL